MFFSLFCNSWDLSMLSKWKLNFWVYKSILPCVWKDNKMAVSFNCLQRNQSSFSSADWKCEVKSVSAKGWVAHDGGKKEGCATKTNELLSHPSRAVVFHQSYYREVVASKFTLGFCLLLLPCTGPSVVQSRTSAVWKRPMQSGTTQVGLSLCRAPWKETRKLYMCTLFFFFGMCTTWLFSHLSVTAEVWACSHQAVIKLPAVPY